MISFPTTPGGTGTIADDTFVIGLKSTLLDVLNTDTDTDISPLILSDETTTSQLRELTCTLLNSTISSIEGKSGKASTFLPLPNKSCKCTIIALPDDVSRNNHPLSLHMVSEALAEEKRNYDKSVQIFVINEQIEKYIGPMAAAIARAFPLYNAKSTEQQDAQTISVSFLNHQLHSYNDLNSSAKAVTNGVRLAAWLGDMTPAELTTDRYAQECKKIASELGDCVSIQEIVGEELNVRGYGGLYAVGKCAACPPRLMILEYSPPPTTPKKEVTVTHNFNHIAFVGKGIVYDSGGLALKSKTGMCGMKHDMDGSAGVLGGFIAAVQLKVPQKITLLLAIAENAIGKEAFRNDDILKMYSGKTVEINNTDAEGRLVLGDGVAHATKHIKDLDVVLDMATLTGAQSICTGKRHGGILVNDAAMEQHVFEAGLRSGDLVYPMLYAPELLMAEFSSKVADMKNSVKDRGNAQSSCAGHFIESHVDDSFEGSFVHVDMAGPAKANERATGYGVALILGILKAPGF